VGCLLCLLMMLSGGAAAVGQSQQRAACCWARTGITRLLCWPTCVLWQLVYGGGCGAA
jgi:hypothetical protein